MSEPKQFTQEVVVADISIPFGSMVGQLVKLALAAIPAMIILSVIGGLIFMALGALTGSLHSHA